MNDQEIKQATKMFSQGENICKEAVELLTAQELSNEEKALQLEILLEKFQSIFK